MIASGLLFSFRQSLHCFRNILLLLLFCLQGCSQRDLCYDHSHKVPVEIVFDWSLVPDAEPSTMVVWFFPVDGSKGLRFELTADGNPSRGSFDAVLRVPAGTYTMVCHNGNTEYNVERGTDIFSYALTTYDVDVLSAMNRAQNAPLPDGADNQAVRKEASRLYAHTHDTPLTVVNEAGRKHKVVFKPSESTIECDVRITKVENLNPDIEASAIITGASEAWNAATQSAADVAVSVPFALEHCGSDCLKGSVTLFGFADMPHKLRVYTSYKYYYDFDVTDQISMQEGHPVINITLSGIKLPQSPGSGMTPGVDEWGEIKEEVLPM